MPKRELRAYRFNATNGLDVTEIAMLAVANNPQLRIDRDKGEVAHAQAYDAGLLPDPQLSYSHDDPTGDYSAGTTTSYSAGFALNLGDLVTRSARVESARANIREVDLNLLWGEWQTIAQSRTLFDRVFFLRKLVVRLQQERAALVPIQSSIQSALHAGNLDYASAGAALIAASDVSDQLAAAQRQLHLAVHDLHNLVGLDASVSLQLTGAPFSINPDHAEVQRALANMSQWRPDMLALQAGYRAQDETLRAAILAQFPAITVGFVKARDNSNISSTGFSIGLSLPLFNGNRGNIAIERATRQQLHDQYTARLLTDRNDVQRLYADHVSDMAQRNALAAHAAQLANARQAAKANYAAGRLDWPTYLALRANSLAADTALLKLDENTHATAIALDALVGNWPSANSILRGKSP